MDYSRLIAKSVQSVPPSGIRRYFDYLNDETISLGVGEPDFPTPERIRREALNRLSKGRIAYTSNAGMPELRELIAQYLAARFDITEYNADNVLITVGASQAIDLAVRAVVDPGDEVIVPEPTYVSYIPSIVMSGGIAVPIVTNYETGFKITPEALKAAITPKTKAIIVPYPNNPTGGIMEYADLEAMAKVVRGTDILLLSDEIYAELTYDGKKHASIASVPGMKERTIILNGFSKAFSMTGWRLGYAAGPFELIAALTKIHQLTMLSAPTPAQYAGIAAMRIGFETDWEDTRYMVEEYDKRRKYMVSAFNSLGLECKESKGAFYAFPSIRKTGLSSEQFCDGLLANANVVTIPGSAFGPAGEGHIRCCYATDLEKIKVAMQRIETFIKQL